ncbi:hypothetical protein BCR34DRAFT_667534 [Clohesyomyces aquaticus]|uniref:Uncharacterized protein n=1 Tax=Clohesyomyces aquaticus TaxID=1231657 RepID=A0A1Y1YZD6_9PLEO|nr:hypothetical protein BCR34DRAFT_667534 [Clohesyomyces aquaticus]
MLDMRGAAGQFAPSLGRGHEAVDAAEGWGQSGLVERPCYRDDRYPPGAALAGSKALRSANVKSAFCSGSSGQRRRRRSINGGKEARVFFSGLGKVTARRWACESAPRAGSRGSTVNLSCERLEKPSTLSAICAPRSITPKSPTSAAASHNLNRTPPIKNIE